MSQVEEVLVVDDALGGDLPVILNADVKLRNQGRQTKALHLTYDQYVPSHVFQPKDLQRIWDNMKGKLNEVRECDDEMTVQGSPMSATPSFTVLNSFGLAAHDSIRDGLNEGVKEPMHGASIFGDDDVRCAQLAAIEQGTLDRESLGLQTKQSATGLAHIADGGKLRGVTDQLGVFTERLIDFRDISVVPAIKPAGLVRLYQSTHPGELPLSTESFRSDMFSYEKSLERTDPRWASVVLKHATSNPLLVARRETAPRRILSRLFKRRVTAYDKIAVGDVSRLFEHLELMLLQVCPSTKGEPDRMLEPKKDPLGHPIVSATDAKMFRDYLQSEDCHFKLHGPPLQVQGGPWGYEIADQLTRRPGQGVPSVDEAIRSLQALGWGGDAPMGTAKDENCEELWIPRELDPIEYGDSID
jgi:hypothetical protein